MSKKIYCFIQAIIYLFGLSSAGIAAPDISKSAGKAVGSLARSARSATAELSSSIRRSMTSGALKQKTLSPKVPKDFPHPEMLHYQFQARPTGVAEPNCYSGWFFQTKNSNGKIFRGLAMASHPFEADPYSPTLERDFTIDAYIEGEFVSIPAHAEIAASMSMGDVVIATIPEEFMEKVQFTPLDTDPVEEGEALVSFGFSQQTPRYVEDRIVTSQTPYCLRTTIPLSRDIRTGTCGTAVGRMKEVVPEESTNETCIEDGNNIEEKKVEFHMSGLHTGSSPATGKKSQDMDRYSNNDSQDIGHATKAFMIDLLVKALSDADVTFPLYLGNVKIFDMHLDEYISYIKLFDDTGKQIWQRDFKYKFAWDQVSYMIQTLSPRYVEMTVRRAQWSPNGHLVESRKRSDPTRYTIRFDFREGTLTKSTPKAR